MTGKTTQQIIERYGMDFLTTLMNLGSSRELETEIERRLRRDGFIKNADGVWCELTLDGHSLRIGELK